MHPRWLPPCDALAILIALRRHACPRSPGAHHHRVSMDQQRVLIVESDNGFALSIAAVLQEAGFASTIALSAADAQRELRERRPNLIVLRAELPDLSGFAFCGRLRKDQAAQGLPIILVSSDATTEALAQQRS